MMGDNEKIAYRVVDLDGQEVLQVRLIDGEKELKRFLSKNTDYKTVDSLLLEGVKKHMIERM